MSAEVLERAVFATLNTRRSFSFSLLSQLLALFCILSHFKELFPLSFLMCYSFQILCKTPLAHLNLFQQLLTDRLKERVQQEKQTILSSENLSKTVRNSRALAGNKGVLLEMQPVFPFSF